MLSCTCPQRPATGAGSLLEGRVQLVNPLNAVERIPPPILSAVDTLVRLEEDVPSRTDGNDTDGVLPHASTDIIGGDGGIDPHEAPSVAVGGIVHGLVASVVGFDLLEAQSVHECVKLSLGDLNKRHQITS